MHDAHVVEVGDGGGELGYIEAYNLFRERTEAFEVDWGQKSQSWEGADGGVDGQRRSPPSMRSRTKKQFSSSWKA